MLQNPVARVFSSQVTGVMVIGVEDIPECDEFPMTMSNITIVVWSMGCIAPNSVATLLISIKPLNRPDKKYTCLQPHARATCPAME